ncbi:PDR/VanB family oxidoreductase [Nocardioides jensenii]|uniref:PDR/VanB family oxidoreductase n=1 Tax=Nocardioides jensenii TaxID=1843 RepID=UPI00146FCCDF|nr:PDR/VanB family oxidoreductase [Nocardioides jensenii]
MNVRVRVVSKRPVAVDVVELTLSAVDESELPSWSAGAHIEVDLPGGVQRQYSLCGPAGDRDTYRIAVLRTPASRGGSRAVHEELAVDDVVTVSAPRNRFALESAPSYVFFAGGIGVTPLVPMAERCHQQSETWEFHYGGRTLERMAYASDLKDRYGERNVTLYPESETGFINIAAILKTAAPSALVYVCGPQPFIEAVRSEARAQGRGGQVRAELFTAEASLDAAGEREFDVHLVRSGITLRVAPDRSVLESIVAAGIDVERDCEVGICGTCITGVIEGCIDHRDHVLDDQQCQSGTSMTICVSRSLGDSLVLDL